MFETRNDKLREKLGGGKKLKGLLILTIVNIVFKGKLSFPSFVGTQPYDIPHVSWRGCYILSNLVN